MKYGDVAGVKVVSVYNDNPKLKTLSALSMYLRELLKQEPAECWI